MLLHLGSLHPIETALLLLVAFGPFVVLTVVVLMIRRRDARQDAGDLGGPAGPEQEELGQEGTQTSASQEHAGDGTGERQLPS